jgi:hypothetical protein
LQQNGTPTFSTKSCKYNGSDKLKKFVPAWTGSKLDRSALDAIDEEWHIANGTQSKSQVSMRTECSMRKLR